MVQAGLSLDSGQQRWFRGQKESGCSGQTALSWLLEAWSWAKSQSAFPLLGFAMDLLRWRSSRELQHCVTQRRAHLARAASEESGRRPEKREEAFALLCELEDWMGTDKKPFQSEDDSDRLSVAAAAWVIERFLSRVDDLRHKDR